MGAKTSNDVMINRNNQRIQAMQKYVPNAKTEIWVGGVAMKPADIIAVFQEDVENRKEVATTKATYGAAVAKRAALEVQRQMTDENLRGWVLSRFGETSAEAKEFGYAPRKLPAVTAETRANAVKLNQATRVARGTVGKKKKLAIKGTLGDAATTPAAPAPTTVTVVGTTGTTTAAAPAAAATALNGTAHS